MKKHCDNSQDRNNSTLNIRFTAILVAVFMVISSIPGGVLAKLKTLADFSLQSSEILEAGEAANEMAGLIASSAGTVSGTTITNPVISQTIKDAIQRKYNELYDNVNNYYRIGTVADFYTLALYLHYFDDAATNPTTGKIYNYILGSTSTDNIPIPATSALEPYTYTDAGNNEVTVYFTSDGTETGTPLTFTYPGIGTVNHPFEGSLTCQYENTNIKLGTGCAALFNNISTNASIVPNNSITVVCNGSRGGLAQTLVIDTDAGAANNMSTSVPMIRINGSVDNTITATPDTGLYFGNVSAGSASAVSLSFDGNALASATSVKSSVNGSAGSLIGTVDNGASVTVSLPSFSAPNNIESVGGSAGGVVGAVKGSLTIANNSSVSLSGFVKGSAGTKGGNAGGLVGSVSGSLTAAGSLSVTFDNTGDDYIQAVYYGADTGNAGGLVGALSGTGSVTLNGNTTVTDVKVASGRNAGGVVGGMTSDTSFTLGTTTNGIVVNDADIQTAGVNGCSGGFCGYINGGELSGFTGATNDTFTFNGDVKYGGFDGGFAGRWKFSAGGTGHPVTSIADSHIKIGTGTSEKANIILSTNSDSAGGLIGSLEAVNPGNCDFTISNTSVFTNYDTTTNSSTSNLGGLVGKVTGNAYLGCSSTAINITGLGLSNTDTLHNGMAIGLADLGCIINVDGTNTVSGTMNNKPYVAYMTDGSVLRLSGSLACSENVTMTSLVYKQNNSLIYCEDGWILTRNTTDISDDIGNYGQIIRNGELTNANDEALITFTAPNGTNHASVDIGTIASSSESAVAVNDIYDFARLAITMSTNGRFSAVNGVDNTNIATLMGSTITLATDATFSLTDTGIESMTRTNTDALPFTGTLVGSGATVTLGIGKHYPDHVATLTDCTKHTRLGLFATLDGATVSNLNIAGIVKGDTINACSIIAGGLAATATGTINVTGTNTSVDMVTPREDKDNPTNTFGGMLGRYDGNNLTMTGCRTDAEILYTHNYKLDAKTASRSQVGGMIARIEPTSNAATADFSDCTLSADISTSSNTDATKDIRVGGLVAIINSADNEKLVLDLNEITFDTPTITATSNLDCGGLLGYDWKNVVADFKGEVNGTIDITGSAQLGGLVNKATGEFNVMSGTKFGATLVRSAAGKADVSDGLLIGNGEALLVVMNCASDFASGADLDNFTHTANYLDYIVGDNVSSFDALSGIPNHGGVVTIETGAGFGVMPTSSTDGWYGLPLNKNTRYYYNVASKAETALNISDTTATLPNGDTLLLFHLKKYTNGVLNNQAAGIENFPSTRAAAINVTGDCNMAGKSFYPTDLDNAFTSDFNNHTVTFGLPAGGNITNSNSQHYGLMTGLFLSERIAASETLQTKNFTVENAVLAGTISSWGGTNSGAVIVSMASGTAGTGNLQDAVLVTNLDNITASGLVVSGASGALLINRIGTCVTTNLSAITAVQPNGITAEAATSLIGTVGGIVDEQDAKKLNIDFSDMLVDGKTQNGKFSTAAYIASLSNANSCVYNFNEAETRVSYCSELDDNVTQYYDTANLVHEGAVYDFTDATVYIPYVVGDISVNVKVGYLDEGCGTKGDPYIIRTYNQLLAVVKIIKATPELQAGFQVNYPNTVNVNNTDTHTTTVLHKTYTFTTGTSLNGPSGSGLTLTNVDLREWIRGAYYNIVGTLTTDMDFIGIGSTEAYPFRGVINGDGTAVINVEGITTYEGFGLVKFADGCVIQGITINYGTPTLSSTEKTIFGGAIGKITNGDNIISAVTVNYDALTAQGRLAYNGGYIGVISKGGVLFKNMGGITMPTITSADSNFFYANPVIGRVFDGYAFCNDNSLPVDANTDRNYTIPNNINTTTSGITLAKSGTVYTATIANGNGLYIFSAAYNSGALATGNTGRKRNASGNAVLTENLCDSYLAVLCAANNATNMTGIYSCDISLTGDCDVSAYKNGFRGFGSNYSDSGFFYIGLTSFASSVPGTVRTVTAERTISTYSGDEKPSVYAGLFTAVTKDAALTFADITLQGKSELRYYNNSGVEIQGTTKNVRVGGFIGYRQNDTTTFSNVKLGGTVSVGDNNSLSVCSHDAAGGFVGYTSSALTFTNCGYQNIKVDGKRYIGGFVGFANASVTVNGGSMSNALLRFTSTAFEADMGVGGIIGYVTKTANNTDTPFADLTVKGTAETPMELSRIVIMVIKTISHKTEFGLGGIAGMIKGCNADVDYVDITGIYIQGFNLGASTPTGKYSTTDYNIADNVRDFTSATATTAEAEMFVGYLNNILTKKSEGTSAPESYCNPGVGAVLGSVGVNGTGFNASWGASIKNCNVITTTDDSVVMFTGNNCGGLIGDYRYSKADSLSIQNCSFNAGDSNGESLLVGGTRAAGMVCYMKGKFAIDGAQVGNTTGKSTFFAVMQKTASYASGIFAEAQYGAEISNCSIVNCNFGGIGVAAIGGKVMSVSVTLNNCTVDDSTAFTRATQSNSSAGGVLYMVEATTVYLNNIAVKNTKIITASTTYKVGGYIGLQTGADSKIYGNCLLWYNNTIGLGNTSSNYTNIDFETVTVNISCGGAFIGSIKNNPLIHILGVSRTDADNTEFNDIAFGTSTDVQVVYTSYGADSLDNLSTENNEFAPQSDGTLFQFGNQSFWGDALHTDEGVRRAVTLNTIPSWWVSNAKWDAASYSALSDRLKMYSGIDTISGRPALPLFDASAGSGAGDDAVTEYINLLTNGGYDIWGVKSASSTYYTYDKASGNFIDAEQPGSIVWNGTELEIGSRYDMISPDGTQNTFTLLTLTFTNASGSGTTADYTMTIPVYFPQVLAMNATVVPLGYEEYSATAFISNYDNGISEVSAMSNGFFSMYIEYIFNDVRNNDAWNLAKKLVYTEENRLPAGTQLVLIDLNVGANYGKAYTYTIPASTDEILWSEFTPVSGAGSFTYVTLKNLKSIANYTATSGVNALSTGPEAIVNHALSADATKNGFGIERYMIIAQFDPQNVLAGNGAVDYGFSADIVNDRNIQITGNDGIASRVAAVKVWNQATVSLSTEVASVLVQKEAGVSIPVTADINFTNGYAAHELGKSNWYGVFADLKLTNGDDRIYFPVGTTVSFGAVNENLLTTTSDNVVKNYRITVNFDGVAAADYRQFTIDNPQYDCHVQYYLTQDPNNMTSGIPANEVVVRMIPDKNIALTATVTGDSNSLGNNVHINEHDPINIDFNIFADFSGDLTTVTNNTHLKLRLKLFSKMKVTDGVNITYPYANEVDITNDLLTLTSAVPQGVTMSAIDADANGDYDYWEVDNIQAVIDRVNYNFSVDFNFAATPESNIATNFRSYMLQAVLTDENGVSVSNEDYFIFLVVKINTEIDV